MPPPFDKILNKGTGVPSLGRFPFHSHSFANYSFVPPGHTFVQDYNLVQYTENFAGSHKGVLSCARKNKHYDSKGYYTLTEVGAKDQRPDQIPGMLLLPSWSKHITRSSVLKQWKETRGATRNQLNYGM